MCEDTIRPKGTVEVQCVKCGWWYWLDALDKALPDGPFVCPPCEKGEDHVFEKCDTIPPVGAGGLEPPPH